MAVNSLLFQFRNSNIVVKIIALNAVIYLFVSLTAFFFELSPYQLTQYFVLPDNFIDFILQPWSFISYSFLHYGFWHLFWNMIWLYMFGAYVLNLFGPKRFLTIYLLGAISGGLLYVLGYNLFPIFNEQTGYLLGASAAVRAIVIFMAANTPNTQIRFFFINLKLWHIGAILVIMDLIQLSAKINSGGMLAHLGGALFGYFYAIQIAKGNDIGKWFENIIDAVENLLKGRKKKPFKKVHRTARNKSVNIVKKEEKSSHQLKVDGILDKIGKSGYESLTKDEKDFLFKAGKED